MEKLVHGEGGVLDLIWAFTEGAIGVEPIIGLIGKAYAEGPSFGGLSLPDEIERVGLETPLAKWMDEMVGAGAEIFIALRPEQGGTGKEEEKTGEFPHFEPDEPSFIAEIH